MIKEGDYKYKYCFWCMHCQKYHCSEKNTGQILNIIENNIKKEREILDENK